MASGKHVPCGPCSFDDATKYAWRWCTHCEEGLCEDCEKVHRKGKSSRNHQVIAIEEYRKIEHISISQICEQHNENLEWFCKSHDEILCVACVPSKHKACSDVIPISIYSANSGQSSVLSDLEEMIEGTLRNVKQCTKNRESISKQLEKQELDIKTLVFETRTKINCHLDKLQEKMLQELKSTTHSCNSKYMKILQKLKSTEEMLAKLREETKHMKEFSSDIQVFLGTRQVNSRIVSEVESIKREIGAAKDYELRVSIHSLITKLSNEIDDFGEIKVSECVAKLDFRDPKIDQAQIEINVPTSRNISDIELKLIKSFQMETTYSSFSFMNVTGCVILPNGHLLIANDTKDNCLIEYSDIDRHIRYIPVSNRPYDIAKIDPDRIVVTYGSACFLEIMNSNTFKVETKISFEKHCLEVSHENGKLYFIYGNGIQVMDLSGENLKTLKTANNDLSCIKSSRDKIFFADANTNQVHCCRLDGEELWKFKSDSIKFPHDMTVDLYHNVYFVDYDLNSLTIIQHDGKNSRTLLTESDELSRPTVVVFDTDKRTLLICNELGKVALYKVV